MCDDAEDWMLVVIVMVIMVMTWMIAGRNEKRQDHHQDSCQIGSEFGRLRKRRRFRDSHFRNGQGKEIPNTHSTTITMNMTTAFIITMTVIITITSTIVMITIVTISTLSWWLMGFFAVAV